MRTETIATYDFDTDAAGLAWFISATIRGLRDGTVDVYVRDQDGRDATRARIVRETLTDGSTVVNLVIDFA